MLYCLFGFLWGTVISCIYMTFSISLDTKVKDCLFSLPLLYLLYLYLTLQPGTTPKRHHQTTIISIPLVLLVPPITKRSNHRILSNAASHNALICLHLPSNVSNFSTSPSSSFSSFFFPSRIPIVSSASFQYRPIHARITVLVFLGLTPRVEWPWI